MQILELEKRVTYNITLAFWDAQHDQIKYLVQMLCEKNERILKKYINKKLSQGKKTGWQFIRITHMQESKLIKSKTKLYQTVCNDVNT